MPVDEHGGLIRDCLGHEGILPGPSVLHQTESSLRLGIGTVAAKLVRERRLSTRAYVDAKSERRARDVWSKNSRLTSIVTPAELAESDSS